MGTPSRGEGDQRLTARMATCTSGQDRGEEVPELHESRN